jgi:hypothetical protein
MAPEDDKPKVINIFTRGSHEAPPAPTEEKEPEVDVEAVSRLQELLGRFEKGELKGLAVVVGVPDDRGAILDAESWVTVTAHEQYLTILGALAMMKDQIIGCAIPNVIHEDDMDEDE